MDRPLVARLTRPFSMPSARPLGARGARPGGGRARGGGDAGARPLHALGARLRVAGARLAQATAGRRRRIALVCALVALPLLAGGFLWLRGSSFVVVRDVRISGVHGPEAAAIETALTDAGRGMSTLALNPARLRAAVAAYPVVRSVHASASFPHGLHVTVSEQPPVAALVVAGTRTAVAADGVVLGPALLTGALPNVVGSHATAIGARVPGWRQLASLAVLGGAPAPLAKQVESVYVGPRGVTALMRGGLIVYFGDASRPHAKWLSLARVLADPSSAGATYVDVRLPSHPAAGFPEGLAPSTGGGESQAPSERGATGESPVGTLATGLSAGGTGGSASTGASASGEPSAAPQGSSTASPETASGGSAAAGGEPSSEAAAAPAGGTGEGAQPGG
jgi:cell division protein FtsQ